MTTNDVPVSVNDVPFAINVDGTIVRVAYFAYVLRDLAKANFQEWTNGEFISEQSMKPKIAEAFKDGVWAIDLKNSSGIVKVQLSKSAFRAFVNGLASWTIREMVMDHARALREKNLTERYAYWNGVVSINEQYGIRLIILDRESDELVFAVITDNECGDWAVGGSIDLYWKAFSLLED